MRRNVRCRSIASGVVRSTGSATPPTRCSIVPSSPHVPPAASRIARVTKAVVVLPFVPVTPATRSVRVGAPKKRSASGAIAPRASATIDLRHADIERALGDHRHGAGRHRRGRVVVAVDDRPGYAHEQRTGYDTAGVVRDVGDLHRVAASHHRAHVEHVEQPVEQHRRSVLPPPSGHGGSPSDGPDHPQRRLIRTRRGDNVADARGPGGFDGTDRGRYGRGRHRRPGGAVRCGTGRGRRGVARDRLRLRRACVGQPGPDRRAAVPQHEAGRG